MSASRDCTSGGAGWRLRIVARQGMRVHRIRLGRAAVRVEMLAAKTDAPLFVGADVA